jgi:HSP90 family molecular chaperone
LYDLPGVNWCQRSARHQDISLIDQFDIDFFSVFSVAESDVVTSCDLDDEQLIEESGAKSAFQQMDQLEVMTGYDNIAHDNALVLLD